jgi:signal transduction histidine kinase
LTYAGNIVLVSIVIAGVTAFVIYILAESLLIGPIKRLTNAMLAFRENPENGTLVIVPDETRRDEIGILERALADTQAELFAMLHQRRHLADLGLAVSKINHDLRNMLTSAQLLSDQVANLDDPQVQRLAPRLVNTLDKAIAFAQTVLDYGRQQSSPPRPQPVDLRAIGFEAALSAGATGHPRINFDNKVPDDVVISVDPDHLARVLVNLFKNAREALESSGNRVSQPEIGFSVLRQEDRVRLLVADNGPGLPPRARENLFVAFEGSAKAGGTGLGLAIARELVEANGGTIELVEGDEGTVFAIDLPLSPGERR